MNPDTLSGLLTNLPDGQIGIAGDFCMDVYWELHPEQGEPSLETGRITTPVAAARYSPGGAGNIAANLRGLGIRRIPCFGALGSDPFGLWLRKTLVPDPVNTDFLLGITRKEYHTPVYCKPLLHGVEQSRMDLGGTPLTEEESRQLIDLLKRQFGRLKVLIVNEQLRNGIHSEYFRRDFAGLIARSQDRPTIIFDGRNFPDAYPGTILKINAAEASNLAFGETGKPPEESGPVILRQNGAGVVITDGERGCHVFTSSETAFIPAIRYNGPVDTVGAGDSFIAGFALAMAKDADLKTAAEFGNACSAVTIRKINQTGVPTPEEIFALSE
jgi:sugar/nucleoside kinase (ribokinase family)